MELIEDAELCVSNVTPVTASPATQTGSQQKRRTRRRANDFNPNRARDARRNELMYLRSKVHEMEAQLQLLTGDCSAHQSATVIAALKATAGTLMQPHNNSVNPVDVSPVSVWEEIASHQCSERHKAELENIRLRLALKAQIKMVNSLEAILMKRSNAQVPTFSCQLLCYCGCVLISLRCRSFQLPRAALEPRDSVIKAPKLTMQRSSESS